MYKLFRFILFQFDAEKVHYFVMRLLNYIHSFGPSRSLFRSMYVVQDAQLETEFLGLKFPNPVGLAAGFDKNAQNIDALADCGFGFIEIGTITPQPQPGNDKPRLFRLKADQAILNRMGFNNDGVEAAISALKKRQNQSIIIGGNIGKNKWTPNEEATADYLICFEALFDYVDYFVVNVSSPNTPNLRALQEKEPLQALLQTLQDANQQKTLTKPILLKIAPDLSHSQLDEIIKIVEQTQIAGLIVANTTISRAQLKTPAALVEKLGAGGISGKPISAKSTDMIRYIHQKSAGKIPMIAVGGIHSPQDALEKLNAGAKLVQLYTGFIYEGPALVSAIHKEIFENEQLMLVSKIKITECPRDAMQGITQWIATEKKVTYLNALLKCGFDVLDFGSFVSAKAIPQMQDSAEVLAQLEPSETALLAIIANARGAAEACSYPQIDIIGYPFSISETFQLRNTNSNSSKALESLDEIAALCKASHKKLRVYLSMGFGNPYGDAWSPNLVADWVAVLQQRYDIFEFALSDTIGCATPELASALFEKLNQEFPDLAFAAHLHVVKGKETALIEACLASGCRHFDTAIGGFGGCPMAKDELTGNLATEALLDYMNTKQHEHTIDSQQLQKAMALSSSIF